MPDPIGAYATEEALIRAHKRLRRGVGRRAAPAQWVLDETAGELECRCERPANDALRIDAGVHVLVVLHSACPIRTVVGTTSGQRDGFLHIEGGAIRVWTGCISALHFLDRRDQP